ncbi:MAG TPA: T9SS type A sorting domain-containing protein [Bacteroidales bacterium]|nr:T9SS type A sorting domain-containing protein [Bacteroidales bacterium]
MKKLPDILLLIILIFCCQTSRISAQPVTFNHTYGSMQYNYGRRIIEAGDRGFFILSNVSTSTANSKIDIIRTDSLGLIIYEKNLGDGAIYWANDFIRTTDHGFLICGLTDKLPGKGYDVLLMKTDSNINVEWERYWGGTDWDFGNAVRETCDGAYIIAGQTFSYGPANENIYVIKTNLLGDTLWTRVFGGDSTDYATSACILPDSTYLIGATTNSFGHGSFDGYVLNLDMNGDTIRTKTYGDIHEDILNTVSQTPDSGFVIAGTTKNYGAIDYDYWVQSYDKNNNLKWKMPEPWEIIPGDNIINNITVTDSSRYLLAGYVNGQGNGGKETVFLAFDENHVFVCSRTAGSSEDEEGFQAIQTADRGYAIVGYSDELGTGLANIYVVKIGDDCSFSSTTEHITGTEENLISQPSCFAGIYPSISSGEYVLHFSENQISEQYSISVFNILGQNIFNDDSELRTGEYKLDLTDAADGMYIVTLTSATNKSSFKVIKEKR